MPVATPSDLERMRAALLFEGPERSRRLSRFWTLLTLATVIASAGVVSDSTATVIGAMIVAPLMTPILGTVLSAVIGDRANLIRSIELVVLGAALVIGVAWLFAHLVPRDIVAATNSQVAARVNPGLIDLVAAIATGAVGAFALVRDDVGDTLPGVAIAISLVPPLAVVGLTLDAGETQQAMGALLLFGANVAAILATGTVVMAAFGVAGAAAMTEPVTGDGSIRRRSRVVIGVFAFIITIPLAASSVNLVRETNLESSITTIAEGWASPRHWRIASVESRGTEVVIRSIGPLPAPDPRALRADLDAQGYRDTDVHVELVPEQSVDLPSR